MFELCHKNERPVILGTDWWTDCDDAVAVRVLVRAHLAKAVKLLGIAISGCMKDSVQSLEYFVRSEGGENIPLGIDLDATDFGKNPPYQTPLAKLSDRDIDNSFAENGVKMYRRLLASSDKRVDLIEIGYPQILSALLLSKPDEYSPLDGLSLVNEKVGKLWIMAGNWENLSHGVENNFARNERSAKAAKILCELFPRPMTFLGWEVSNMILTGSKLEKDDLLHKVMTWHGSENGRSSWDPMLVLAAVIGDEEKAGYNVICGKAKVAEDGSNSFVEAENGNHKILRKAKENDWYRDMIDGIIG